LDPNKCELKRMSLQLSPGAEPKLSLLRCIYSHAYSTLKRDSLFISKVVAIWLQ
jgi:hypothetical protein